MTEGQSNYNSKRLVAVAIVAIIGLIGVTLFLQPKNISVQNDQAAQDSEQQSDKAKDDAKPNDDDKVSANQMYTYTAAAGDSYTLLARQAVATVGTGLSDAERVAAETKLTQDAGQPYLEVGQTVEFTEATVQAAVDWAASLSTVDKAAWQAYVDTVILPAIK